jgi:hypothetical protein
MSFSKIKEVNLNLLKKTILHHHPLTCFSMTLIIHKIKN